MKNIDNYGSGMLKSIDLMIDFCNKGIQEIKSKTNLEVYNKISNGGRLWVYNRMLVYLKNRRKIVLQKKHETERSNKSI